MAQHKLQAQFHELLKSVPAPATAVANNRLMAAAPLKSRFSPFRLADMNEANQATEELVRTFKAEGIDATLGKAKEWMQEGRDPELIKHALKMFVTHHPHGTGLSIPSLEEREPYTVLPSVAPQGTREAGNKRLVPPSPEDQLLWFREDPKMNEHHEHWHVVYPITGVPSEYSPLGGKLKDRQGELFLYMHRQMLARYDSERVTTDLGRVEPWSTDAVDPYGYDPGQYLRDQFSVRQPGKSFKDYPEGSLDPSEAPDKIWEHYNNFIEACTTGYFTVPNEDGVEVKLPVTTQLLGSSLEADIGSVATVAFNPKDFASFYNGLNASRYGNIHNDGHDVLSVLSEDPINHPGVMTTTRVACRDHVFFRWHKMIDNIWETWEVNNRQKPNDFSDAPKAVSIRQSIDGSAPGAEGSPDILLTLTEQIKVPWDNWQKFGQEYFGNQNWNETFYQSDLTTDTLETQMLRRVITVEPGAENPASPEPPHEIEYLDQKEFFYFFRLQNSDQTADQDVTARVFLCDAEYVDDRRMWIEMDKFRITVPKGENMVVWQPASLSSVIRKPATKPPAMHQTPVSTSSNPQLNALVDENYCDCGWPYNLLLPRGTEEGRKYRLMIMLTDWNKDHVSHSSKCGSMSYCGAKEEYPDTRPMGYPFDRMFKTDEAGKPSFDQTFAGLSNVAWREITIRHITE
ncbi:tyrosinase family protein [Brevibacillus dissolubilis]|uniref:tyrosinase family protein n=1 Tax=Brevibacillus dissolubilis TaxID=1844116 RepID=UPI0011176F3C|nr:tyrosinase family protein [Brevibacillus dissolubilis]